MPACLLLYKIIATDLTVFYVFRDDLDDPFSCSARYKFIRCHDSLLCGVLHWEINMPSCVNAV